MACQTCGFISMAFPALSRPLLVILTLSTLASCTTMGGANPPSPSLAANSSITALQGGLISRIAGLTINETDRLTALKTEYKALEAAPGGQELTWEGSSITGTVVAAAPFQVGTQNCRQYKQTVISQGQTLSANGTACRNDTGTWTPL